MKSLTEYLFEEMWDNLPKIQPKMTKKYGGRIPKSILRYKRKKTDKPNIDASELHDRLERIKHDNKSDDTKEKKISNTDWGTKLYDKLISIIESSSNNKINFYVIHSAAFAGEDDTLNNIYKTIYNISDGCEDLDITFKLFTFNTEGIKQRKWGVIPKNPNGGHGSINSVINHINQKNSKSINIIITDALMPNGDCDAQCENIIVVYGNSEARNAIKYFNKNNLDYVISNSQFSNGN